MNKKIILSLSLLLLLGTAGMSAQNRRAGNSMRTLPKKEMCLQLYSIRSLIGDAEKYAQNHATVFKELKKMGFTSVEAANYNDGKFYGVSPEQFKKDCENAGLEPLSSHATRGLTKEEVANHDFTKALDWWRQAIKAHKAAGMKFIITPYSDVPKTLAELQTRCDYYNEVGKLCNAGGLKYGYHSHSHEYKKVEDAVMLDYMLQHIDADNMFFQMDVYWAVMGQVSPVEYFEKYPGRFKVLHIKDKYEVGQSGMVGFDAIFRNAKNAGLQYFVVELEGMPEGKDIMDGVRTSAEYILHAPFVKASYSK